MEIKISRTCTSDFGIHYDSLEGMTIEEAAIAVLKCVLKREVPEEVLIELIQEYGAYNFNESFACDSCGDTAYQEMSYIID